jgi:cellulose synthase/poly-beta-1,6-N-acetylglucosamine synthase-like glycosyltransferase
MVTSSLGILRIISGAFGAFRREALEQIGGWDVGPGLDGDITLKIRKLGYEVYFEPSAIALTSVPSNFWKLAVQRIRWSRSLIRFRLRRHNNLFLPGENFRFSTLFSLTESLFFDLVLNFMWHLYWVDILFNFTNRIGFILMGGFFLYSISKFIEYLVVLILSERWKQKLSHLLYLPGMVFYTGFYMRFVRTFAYVKEFLFKSSYDDSWNPPKTSAQAKKLDEKINR